MNEWIEAEQRVERAQQLAEAQRWADALTEIEAALDINPHNAAWHAHHAFLLEQLGRCGESLRAYERSLDLEPADPDVRFAYGITALSLGRFARAVEVFSDLAREFPNDERAYCHRIAAYAELGLHDQAEEMFYLAQQIDEHCPHCFFHIGGSLAARGFVDRAIACWKRVLELEPMYPEVNAKIGRAYRSKGLYDSAREYYLNELRNDAGDIDLLFELAELAIEADQPASAVAKLQQVIELDPDHAQAHFTLGEIYLRRRHFARALQCFQAAATLGEPLPRLNARRGEAALHLGRFADARKFFELACEQNPDDAGVQVGLGEAWYNLGKFDRAADAFRKALARQPNAAPVHYRLGSCLMRLGRIDAGLSHCEEALRLSPRLVPAMRDAVAAHIQLGQWGPARRLAKAALAVEPGDEWFRRIVRRLWTYRLARFLSRPIPFMRKKRNH